MSRINKGREERGAVLVLALIFLTTASLIIGALSAWTVNDLNNTSRFASARSLQYAAKSATNIAVQSIRYTPLLSTGQTLNASPPSYCWGNSAPSQLSNIDGAPPMSVWCSTAYTPASALTRVVTVSTCLSSVSGVTITAGRCAANPLLQAVVTFDDYPAGVSGNPGLCVVYCGTTLTVNSWVSSPVTPTVTSMSATSGPSSGGSPITITGTGFAAGSTVNFVQESGGTPATANVVLAATAVTFNFSTQITATSPQVSSGTTYFVTVTTPTGTSPYSNGAIFSYPPAGLAVTSISPTPGQYTGGTSGPYTGGTSVAITGTGFVNGSTVNFVQEVGGTPVSPSVTVPATGVVVSSTVLITALSPTVTAGTTYFVTVTTPFGTSAFATNDIFIYPAQPPAATTISPTSGPSAGGTSVAITGSGFTAGATVNFVNETGGVAGTPTTAAASVVVNSATSITAVSPTATVGSTYFVTVTTSAGTSANPPVFTYTAPSYSTWPLNESTGLAATDNSGNNHNGAYSSTGVAYGTAGPYPSNTARAVTFDGASGAVGDPVGVAVTATSAQSEEVWFNTTTTLGGVLITSYSSPAISGGGADRLTYMNASGQVVFGTYNGAVHTISSPRSYNDGTWHLVDAVFSPTAGTSPAGLSLYIDGALVAANPTYTTANGFTSYTRLASGAVSGWPNTSGTLPSYWKGSEAFASIYRYALSAAQVAADYAAAEAS